MSINLNDSPEEIINQLSPIEKQILYVLGKLKISVSKNINEDTIKKKLPSKYHKDFSNVPMTDPDYQGPDYCVCFLEDLPAKFIKGVFRK